MARSRIASTIALAALGSALAACGGGYAGSGTSLPSTLGNGELTVSDTADALIAHRTGTQSARAGIAAASALGARMRQLSLIASDDAWRGVTAAAKTPSQQCRDGIELFAPDRNGDPDSTEALFFYNAACTQLAIDDVRLYAPVNASTETVNRTDSFYLPQSSSAIAGATTNTTISDATFGNYGLPIAADGFAAIGSTTASIAKTPVLSASAEFVMMPGSQASNAFCEDSAGYDPAGIASLDETFGWQGGVLSAGTRTSAANATTWSATPAGTAYSAPIGALSIGTGAQNLSCPISTPDFSLDGGTAIGTYSMPISVEFDRGILWSLSVRNARLPNGDTLNLRTVGHQRARHDYIVGRLTNGQTPIATLSLNGFGNGELTVTSTGAQYKIVDWMVVQ